jgi:hypothetical protein
MAVYGHVPLDYWVRVRPRRLWRSLDDVDAVGRQHRIKGIDELGVAVTDQEPQPVQLRRSGINAGLFANCARS